MTRNWLSLLAPALAGLLAIPATHVSAQVPLFGDGSFERGLAFDTVIGGADINGEPLFICRSADGGDGESQLGKTRSDWRHCAYGFQREEKMTSTFETMRPRWEGKTPILPIQSGNTFGWDAQLKVDLPICRVFYNGSLQVGKGVAGKCNFAFDGAEIALSNFGLLRVTFGMTAVRGNPLPKDAIVAGKDMNGELLYPCIASLAGGTHPGKTRRDWNACHIGYGGKEHAVTNYTVFVPAFYEFNRSVQQHPVFLAGRDADGEPLGICQANVQGSKQVGKYREDMQRCFVSFGGAELELASGFKTLREHGPFNGQKFPE